jgi:uncharacterized RDD family membrane protein YckC
VIIAVPVIILYILGAAVTGLFTVLGVLVGIGGSVWFAIQVGQAGSSPGMRAIGLKCVSAKTGQPLGAAMGFVRALIHGVLDALCFIPFVVDMLFPLWDAQKQTLADKIVSTVVLKVPAEGFSITPKS